MAGLCGTRVCRLQIGDCEKSHSTLDRDISAVRNHTDRRSERVYFAIPQVLSGGVAAAVNLESFIGSQASRIRHVDASAAGHMEREVLW